MQPDIADVVDLQDRYARRSFRWLLAGVFIIALALRLVFILDAQFSNAIHGDAVQYVSYAYNLLYRGVFSMALPDAAVAAPDSFRGPGYPLVLAALMRASGDSTAWLGWAMALQALLGSATAVLTAVWLEKKFTAPLAISAGLLVAVWPHLITTSAYLVTETLTGFTIMLGLVLSERALHGKSSWRAISAGCTWGFAYLVNPVCLVLPFLLSPWLWRLGGWRQWLGLILVFLLFPVAWSVRNASIPDESSASRRALGNFVEGSWPEYHAAYDSRNAAREPALIIDAISREEAVMVSDPRIGLRAWWARMSMQPSRYLGWYLLEKPYLLWDWSIRIGNGDIYLYPTEQSPFERFGAMRMLKRGAQIANPALFLLACACSILVLIDLVRRGASSSNLVLGATTLVFIYLTTVHVILQAEPRYSIAYRPIEFALAFGALWMLANYAATLRARTFPRRHESG